MSLTQQNPATALERFDPTVRQWFCEAFAEPTAAQQQSWPVIADGRNTLLLAPTGSGKTLAAFLAAIDRIMFPQNTVEPTGVRVLYVSPLKALGVDVERNLRTPIAGVTAVANRTGVDHRIPTIGIRTGDTTSRDRLLLNRQPPDILITTPESLYLMLTSRARSILTNVQTLIIDEIHSMVATKRGAHLFLSLERLEKLRQQSGVDQPLQRIGLSATQRPLNEIARMLGGASIDSTDQETLVPRPVEIIEAGRRKPFDLKIEVPVEDMSDLTTVETSPAAAGPSIPSIWPAIHPRLVELIRNHRSTMIFVNSRRLAERLATSINELAEEPLARAHHGSIAKATRQEIEDQLKRGQIPAIVATSSLELGIDMGAVDLVIQIEAPPTIASGIQRIGRAGHHVGGRSNGVVFPKYRGDLLACSAAAARMATGEVEETFYPRNPLDVLAQQLVAMVSLEPVHIDELFATVRQAASFHDLPRSAFENVLDLLSGRYPSDEFSELRPRIVWDRLNGMISPRKGTQRLAIVNAGTIPDRGLYGVFLAGEEGRSNRVGELDEEMVFETRPGDVFLLGASSWRVMDITNDRVLVTPAPGEPGRMPYWHGDGPGRPLEFGQAIGKLTRELLQQTPAQSRAQLVDEHRLDQKAAQNLLQYLRDQAEATQDAPSDKTIVVESFLDEVGDWRVAILTPFGARVHVPWAMAVAARLREESGAEIDMMWSDDGIVFRLPESEEIPDDSMLFPSAEEIEELVTRELGSTALFAARFRENAARALLLPRRQPGKRTPLWLQRRKSADLLEVAARYPNFPILLETYRECLRDVFDLRGLKQILKDVQRRSISIRRLQTQVASPFASSLLFAYTANFMYEGDTPLAERRAQTLALDHSQLCELLGDAELRELLDPNAVDELGLELLKLDPRFSITHEDGLCDILRQLGDLSEVEISSRLAESISREKLQGWLKELMAKRRVIEVRIAGESRFAAAEDAGRLRDALGVALPLGLPDAFLESIENPLLDLVSRYARTHIPFKAEAVAERLGLGIAPIQMALTRLMESGRLLEGEFLPGGRGREWCDPHVLKLLKRRSLAKLRKEIAPVEQQALARFLPRWQSMEHPKTGLDGLLDVIEQLQGLALPATVWEQEVLPKRVRDYRSSDLDELSSAGEIVWRGFDSLGSDDGRIAFYLTDHLLNLAPVGEPPAEGVAQQIYDLLAARGALFFDDLVRAIGGFRNDCLDGLWQLVWQGLVSNDTLAPLRSLRAAKTNSRRNTRQRSRRRSFRSRRQTQRGSEGRWRLLIPADVERPSVTEQQLAQATQLIDRYGVLTREMITHEGHRGGFSSMYPILKAMEEAGKLRRGYFVAGLGAAQFAIPGAEDQLRDCSRDTEEPETPLILASTDPANPYGAAIPWPKNDDVSARPQRTAGSRVILNRGQLVGYLGRTGQSLMTFLPTDNPAREQSIDALMTALTIDASQHPIVLTRINGAPPHETDFFEALKNIGFFPTSRGLMLRSKASGKHDRGTAWNDEGSLDARR